jgi:hypothetical protein
MDREGALPETEDQRRNVTVGTTRDESESGGRGEMRRERLLRQRTRETRRE